MPYQERQFVNDEIYHLVLRRIGDKLLFKNVDDYFRGIFSIYEFNNANSVQIAKRRQERERFKKSLGLTSPESGEVRPKLLIEEPDRRDLLVEILCFCFMPNHIHLLTRQLKEGGISRFMQKLGSGYPPYFKEKYSEKKTGHFFQERFTAVHIKTENQLRTVFVYIHTNPIAIVEPNWKEIGIKNPEKAIKFLEEKYRWSSYWDYLGKKNFPSVSSRDYLSAIMDSSQGCREAVNDWIRYKGEIRKFPEFALENKI